MDWPAYIKQWNQLPVKVWDVRHIVMQPGALLDDYRLPSNIFLLARRGNARIRLDGRECAGSGFQLLHGKKGARLDIWAQEQPFDYYKII
jgi:iron complex transport system substrate-binding protein